MKAYDVVIETKELHRLEAYGDNETEAIASALKMLDLEVPLSNRNISYNVMDLFLKDEYLN